MSTVTPSVDPSPSNCRPLFTSALIPLSDPCFRKINLYLHPISRKRFFLTPVITMSYIYLVRLLCLILLFSTFTFVYTIISFDISTRSLNQDPQLHFDLYVTLFCVCVLWIVVFPSVNHRWPKLKTVV